jgi:hypothetical protein
LQAHLQLHRRDRKIAFMDPVMDPVDRPSHTSSSESSDRNASKPRKARKRCRGNKPPVKQLDASWRYFNRGAKDLNSRYSATCKPPGCEWRQKQGHIVAMQKHVLHDCRIISAEDRSEATILLGRAALEITMVNLELLALQSLFM